MNNKLPFGSKVIIKCIVINLFFININVKKKVPYILITYKIYHNWNTEK